MRHISSTASAQHLQELLLVLLQMAVAHMVYTVYDTLYVMEHLVMHHTHGIEAAAPPPALDVVQSTAAAVGQVALSALHHDHHFHLDPNA